MNTSQGFSLVEVLVSLFLATSAALGVLSHQWQMSRFLNDVLWRSKALTTLDNAAERVHANLPCINPALPFRLHQVIYNHKIDLLVSWPAFFEKQEKSHGLQQELVLIQ